jgi:uncharacterized RDD family membrane protein YckC
VSFAGRWRRLGGWAIELVVVSVLLATALLVGAAFTGEPRSFLGFLLGFTGLWLYFAGLESSARQTTLSGRWLGTRVTGLEGERITFGRATARHFSMYLSAITPFGIGYLMAFWTRRRQSLHDWLTSTVVVKKD